MQIRRGNVRQVIIHHMKLEISIDLIPISNFIFNSSTFLYLKFLFIWILIMIADFLLEFRFEFLWPFWLVIRSLHDSFKYQGIVRFIKIELFMLFFFFKLVSYLPFVSSYFQCFLHQLHLYLILYVICFYRFNGSFLQPVLMYGFNTFGIQVSHKLNNITNI